MMEQAQKQDMIATFGPKWHNVGNIDYVGAWYKRAADYMRGTTVEAALVSTNSITQGEQVADLWQPLMRDGLTINFAHHTFRWDSEASLKAHVHCVIVGFSYCPARHKYLFSGELKREVRHINAYLIEGDDVFVGSRPKPIADVPEIGIGNQPIDDGNYLFTEEEMLDFIAKEPQSRQYFHPWYGAQEFIHQKPRYCLWLGDCSPAEIRKMPHSMKRVENVRNFRLASKRASTLKLADRPTRFQVENMPEGNYIIIPRVSSEKRRYIPMGFLENTNFSSDAVHIIPNATLYHFGVLQSNVHMAWIRTVCGRLEMRYRYSKDVVYDNFPWPDADEAAHKRIEQTAQAILDARALYPDSSLADLYDPVLMPAELREAHRQNDSAVMAAYGFSQKITESECVAALFALFSHHTK